MGRSDTPRSSSHSPGLYGTGADGHTIAGIGEYREATVANGIEVISVKNVDVVSAGTTVDIVVVCKLAAGRIAVVRTLRIGEMVVALSAEDTVCADTPSDGVVAVIAITVVEPFRAVAEN
jgi:hypothetical protein